MPEQHLYHNSTKDMTEDFSNDYNNTASFCKIVSSSVKTMTWTLIIVKHIVGITGTEVGQNGYQQILSVKQSNSDISKIYIQVMNDI